MPDPTSEETLERLRSTHRDPSTLPGLARPAPKPTRRPSAAVIGALSRIEAVMEDLPNDEQRRIAWWLFDEYIRDNRRDLPF